MTFVTKLHASAVIIYSVIAAIISYYTKIEAIHYFNAFMLCAIFYNILDWRFGNPEGDDND